MYIFEVMIIVDVGNVKDISNLAFRHETSIVVHSSILCFFDFLKVFHKRQKYKIAHKSLVQKTCVCYF